MRSGQHRCEGDWQRFPLLTRHDQQNVFGFAVLHRFM